ncbi:MAG: hypothetical protein Q8K75_03885 [Chlamydiales bacterium]|nr:hypothetical protein [Chlamydiales bacterium]
MKPTVLAISPYMQTERGHFYTYHKAVNDAANLLGWPYKLAVPKTNSIQAWPPHWKKCLDDPNPSNAFSPHFLALLWAKYRYRRSVSGFLKAESNPNGNNILFLEYVSLRQFRPIVRSLLGYPAKNLTLWMLFRYVPAKLPGSAKGFKRCLQALSWILGKDRIRILVDTELLVPHWEKYLGMPVTVMPIPHTGETLPEVTARPEKRFVCWCRGLPKPNIGVYVVNRLLDCSHAANSLKLLFSEKAIEGLPVSNTPFEIVPEILPTASYLQCMAESDFIVIPYAPEAYNSNSSGIFVEAVTYGKIPLVSEGTWTAEEVKRFDLHDLVIDWQRPDLAEHIVRIGEDAEIRAKLLKMQSAYHQYHTVPSFAEAMSRL